MAENKIIVRILDDMSSSQIKMRHLSRPVDGLKNMIINELGQVEKRKGYTKYNQTTLNPTHPIVGLHRFYNESDKTKQCLVACGKKLYKLDPSYPHNGTELSSNEGV